MTPAPAQSGRPPARARSAQARASILAAAERIFAREGLAGARTEAIAAAAGVNKAMLFYYFDTKESLYVAIVEEHAREFNDKALAVLAAPGPARAILLRYVELHFDFMSGRHRYAPLFHQLMLAGDKRLGPVIVKYIKPRARALQQLVKRGVRGGEFRRVDPLHASVSIASLIVFYFSAGRVMQQLGHADPYGPATLRRRKREVLAFIRHALFADPEAPIP